MALARQCPECGVNWPDSTGFHICPRCRERCRVATCPNPLTHGEAAELIKRVKFERMYAERERARQRNGRPSPEDIGKREAYDLIKKWHEVRVALDG